MLSGRIILVIASAWSTSSIASAITPTLELPSTADVAVIGSSLDNVTDVEIVEGAAIQSIMYSSGNTQTNQSFPLSVSDNSDYTCLSVYGTPLPVACRFAFMQMPNSEMTVTFGNRKNTENPDIPLPFRISSRRPYVPFLFKELELLI